MLKAVDGSYTTLGVDDAQKLRASGIEAWGQCLWTGTEQPDPRVENLRNALIAGMLVFGYISVSHDHDGPWHVAQGRAGVPDDIWAQLVLVFVDVELPGIPVATVRGAVEALAAVGKRRAIYTSQHAWVDLMGDPTDFTDCLLWNANWDFDPDDVDFVNRPFGGWTVGQLVGEQYTGGVDIGDVYVDQNMFNQDLFMQEKEYEMDAEIERQLRRDMACQRWGAMIMTGDDAQIEQALREMAYVRVLAGLPMVPEGK